MHMQRTTHGNHGDVDVLLLRRPAPGHAPDAVLPDTVMEGALHPASHGQDADAG